MYISIKKWFQMKYHNISNKKNEQKLAASISGLICWGFHIICDLEKENNKLHENLLVLLDENKNCDN